MAAIVWDQVGDRFYALGLDHGVLYSSSNLVEVTSGEYGEPDLCPIGVPWNGLVSVDTSTEGASVTPYYFDGQKNYAAFSEGDFSAKITAITYPEPFEEFLEYVPGMYLDNQPPKSFGLSYRTLIADDLVGESLGYKIHILYNLIAVEDSIQNKTIDSNVAPISFVWNVTSVPETFPGRRPTAHVTLDSTKLLPEALAVIEDILYGTVTDEPRLPTALELVYYTGVTITDNEDGTWTAEGASYFIEMLDANTFQIDGANVTTIDANEYQISSTHD